MERNTALVLIFALCIMGPVAVLMASAFASIMALGRNPSATPKIFTAMVIAMVFALSVSVIAMLITFQLFTSTPGA
jgi:F0F1-type ATP synthase membrane subunit c/vacuolar-type H+-ATPase subunit K